MQGWLIINILSSPALDLNSDQSKRLSLYEGGAHAKKSDSQTKKNLKQILIESLSTSDLDSSSDQSKRLSLYEGGAHAKKSDSQTKIFSVFRVKIIFWFVL